MKIISTGTEYKVYDSSLIVYDNLPAKTYIVAFNERSGFSLIECENIEIKEKTYGVHNKKVQKVINAFQKTNRNLGVILSGDKGIGKSLFAKMLSIKGLEEGYPVILVDGYIPGIADFINQIQQEVVILLDEFDKTFGGKRDDSGSRFDPQTEMLTLFDGMSIGKKLFIITCNDLGNLNDYLVNRPGRFHYHFRFDYPNAEEIREYLNDKGIYKDEIDKVINFSSKVKLNYDCLRAIAFELSCGECFEDAILDLNIVNVNGEVYSIIACFDDGSKLINKSTLDLFCGDNEITINYNFPHRYWGLGGVTFVPTDAQYDVTLGAYKITKDLVEWELDYDEDDFTRKDGTEGIYEQLHREWMNKKFEYLLIKHMPNKNLHYII